MNAICYINEVCMCELAHTACCGSSEKSSTSSRCGK